MQKMSLLIFSETNNQFPHWKGNLNLVRAPKRTQDQLLIQDLVGDNKVVIDKISTLKKLDILQNNIVDYDELQRETDLNVQRF